MKYYYFKFTKLPFIYTSIKAVNSAVAKKKVSEYRSDSVLAESVSFDDMHNGRFEYQHLDALEERDTFEIKSSFTGKSEFVSLKTNKIEEDLKSLHKDVPGIKTASIFTIAGNSAFGVKNTDALTKFIMNTMSLDKKPKELEKNGIFIPLCFFKKVKKKTESNDSVNLLLSNNSNEQLD